MPSQMNRRMATGIASLGTEMRARTRSYLFTDRVAKRNKVVMQPRAFSVEHSNVS